MTGICAVFLMLLAAVFIQSRLLCNLFDGMVALEFAQETPSGSLFNDAPDRLSDSIILIAAGYATNDIAGVAFWGWAAALSAVMTAYARTLCASAGAPMRFQGPMAKSHRMALITLACLLTVCETLLAIGHYSFFVALLITTVGSLLTTWRRLKDGYLFLENKR
jgi:phosphatidylglycerophosphate synthase